MKRRKKLRTVTAVMGIGVIPAISRASPTAAAQGNASRTAAKPAAAETDVEECPEPKGSALLSERFWKPESPPYLRRVCINCRLPVSIL